MAHFHEGRIHDIASYGDWTNWRYHDLNVYADDILRPGFFQNFNRGKVNMHNHDLVDVECASGYFRARVYELEKGTNVPLLMQITAVFDKPESGSGSGRKRAA